MVNLFDVLQRARAMTDEVIVGFSCGRDSLITLDLCHEYFRKVHAFFMFMVPGLSFQERTLGYAERRWGVKIERLPHWQLGDMFRSGSLAFENVARLSVPSLTITDIEEYMRGLTGARWIVTGERKQESLQRRGMLTKYNGIWAEKGHIYPLADWTGPNVSAYLNMRHIPLPPDYQLWGGSFGQFHEREMLAIREHFPADYARILEVFPFAEAVVKRADFRAERAARQGHAVSEV